MSAEDHTLACHLDFPKYVITGLGGVISLVRPTAVKHLRPQFSGKYLALTLAHRDGGAKRIYLHQLMAETFHGAQPPGREVRHRDGCRVRNWQSNIEWGTRSQNMQDKVRHGTDLRGDNHPSSVLTTAQVLEIRRLRAAGTSLTDLERQFGVSRMTVFRAATGRSWRHLNGGGR